MHRGSKTPKRNHPDGCLQTSIPRMSTGVASTPIATNFQPGVTLDIDAHQNLNKPVNPNVRGRRAVAEYSVSVTLA